MPPPPALSGIEKRVTSVLVGAGVVNSTEAPVLVSVTARRPDASPARSPIVLFGLRTCAPPPVTASSASTCCHGTLAPRPMNSDCSLVLLPCLAGI